MSSEAPAKRPRQELRLSVRWPSGNLLCETLSQPQGNIQLLYRDAEAAANKPL